MAITQSFFRREVLHFPRFQAMITLYMLHIWWKYFDMASQYKSELRDKNFNVIFFTNISLAYRTIASSWIPSQSNLNVSIEKYMGKMLEDGKNVQSLVVIVLDVFPYNFWMRHNINKRFFSCERWVFVGPTVKIS